MFLFRNSVTGDVLHPLDPSIRLQLEDIDDCTSFFVYKLANTDEGNYRATRLEFWLHQSIVSGEDYDMWLADQEKVTAWAGKHKKWDPFEEFRELHKPGGERKTAQVPYSSEAGRKVFESKYRISPEEYEMKRKLEDPPFALVEEVKDHINPSHYQDHFHWESLQLQWIETQSAIMSPERFEGALELQARKYMDRRGGKDDEVQELKKSLWYLKYWLAYVIKRRTWPSNCNGLLVSEVEHYLNL